jgi:hypothetical protein
VVEVGALQIYVVNAEKIEETDELGNTIVGYRPVVTGPTGCVGNLYEKTGNVRKYVLKTNDDLTGLPGVFGPIGADQVQAALDGDNIQGKSWDVGDVSGWSLEGEV